MFPIRMGQSRLLNELVNIALEQGERTLKGVDEQELV